MTWIGRHRFDLASCASTSDEAARLARAGAGHGTLIVADAQTAGRGRLGRAWVSQPGNLYLSAVLRLPLAPADVPAVTLAVGVAVCDALRKAGATDAALKWPNDVVVSYADRGVRKIAGILVEAQSQGGRVDAVIVGIGVNLRGPVPAELADRAIALDDLVADAPDRDAFATLLLPGLESWIDRYLAGGAAMVVPAWELRMCAGLRVRIDQLEGAALGLEPDGALQVRDDSGVIHRIRSGEVEPVHP